MDSWDAIVIGSGLGGLAAAAALSNRGKRVLVLERLSNLGGAATVYRHGALTMEASLHEADGETVHSPAGVFSRLGLLGEIETIPTNEFYAVRGGPLAAEITIPHGLEHAREAVFAALPHARRPLEMYFRELDALYAAFHALEDMAGRGPSALLGLLFSGRLFTLCGVAKTTLARRFEALFGNDEAVKVTLGAPLWYFDDDPAKLAYLVYAGVWSRYVEAGSYYFRGGSRALTLALAHRVAQHGGEARHACAVQSILLDSEGRAAGVSYSHNGESKEARSPLVFAGASPTATAEMLPASARAEFSARYASFEPSISLFNISIGLSRPAADFGVSAYSNFIYPYTLTRYADVPKAAAAFGAEPSGALPPYVLTDYGRLDAGIRQPNDPYLVSLTGVDRLAWWRGLDEAQEKARRQRWIETLIADVERRYPGFAGAVTQAEIATSRTMQSILGTPQGEVYGFRPTPERIFGRPPMAATSVPGLFLSSAYTVSGGYSGSMQGGLLAADSALRSQRGR